MATNRIQILEQTLLRIPLFSGLQPEHVRRFIGVSQPRRFEPGESVCSAGSFADELFILLSGSLGVVTEDGSLVATLTPVTTVGEMGIVARGVRRAAVEAVDTSNVLVIPHDAFAKVVDSDTAIEARIYRNVVDILGERILQDNVRMREYLVEKVRQEGRIRDARHRADAATELLQSKTGMTAQQAHAMIEEHVDSEPHLRVLIVDDESEVRHMLAGALADYDVVEARDGEEALEEIGDDPPDLVITDLRMPGLDGYELVRRLKARFPETPVLAISGFASDEDVVDYAFDAFLEKPMNLKEFRELVDIALTGEAS